jgi:uncharacterized protein YceK/LysM repeat protein
MLASKVKYIYLFLLILCTAITLGGFANRNARSSEPYTVKPLIYPATLYALRGDVATEWCNKLVPKSKNSGWLFSDDLIEKLFLNFGVGLVGYVYSLVIEVPISLIADTVLLPKDIRQVKMFDAGENVFENALFGNDWPVTPETLRANYRSKNCDPLIQRLLKDKKISYRRQKILCLIEAGVGLDYIASFDELDTEMAERIMTQVVVDHPTRFGALNRLAKNPLTPPNVMIEIIQADPYEDWSHSPLEGIINNPAVSPEVLEALAKTVEKPAILIKVAQHQSISPETLDKIAQRNIVSVNRIIAANPGTHLQTLITIAAFSPNDPEIDAALAVNPKTLPEMLHQIVKNVSNPLLGKWILKDVSLHPATTDETLRLILKTCDTLDQHPAAWDAKDVIEEARQNASKRIKAK